MVGAVVCYCDDGCWWCSVQLCVQCGIVVLVVGQLYGYVIGCRVGFFKYQ